MLTAVLDGRLTLDDIRLRLHDNPVQIFSILDPTQTNVEVVIGRKAPFSSHSSCWSPVQQTSGEIHRIVIHGQMDFLDGSLFSTHSGRDISGANINHPSAAATVVIIPPLRQPEFPSHIMPFTSAGATHHLTIQQHAPPPRSLIGISKSLTLSVGCSAAA